MKKTVILIILAVVTCVCIVVGLAINSKDFFDNLLSSFTDYSGKAEPMNNDNVIREDLEDIKAIDMELSNIDVDVKKGEKFEIQIKVSSDNYMPTYSVENGVLKVEQKVKHKEKLKRVKNKIVVTFPKGTQFDDFNISNDIGDILTDEVDTKTFLIELNVGDIYINDTKSDSVSISANTGSVKIEDSSFGATTVSNNIGDIKLVSCTPGKINISNNIGNIKCIDCQFDHKAGDYSATTNTGDIKLVECDGIDKFNVDFSTDMGEVKVDGKNCKKNYHKDADDENAGKFTLSTNIGDIKMGSEDD